MCKCAVEAESRKFWSIELGAGFFSVIRPRVKRKSKKWPGGL
jgi:hypothetical protein